jgi:GPH family glycoside/pentoside/hexuronide:cation symporter
MPNLAGMFDEVMSQAAAIRLSIGILSAIAAIAMLVPALFIKERDYIESKPTKTKAFKSLLATFKDKQFRRFVYSDVIYFFAVTLFQTGLADFETNLMGIPADRTFTLTVLMTVISLSLYPVVNRLAPKLGKKNIIIVGFFSYAAVFLITALSNTATIGDFHVFGIVVAVLAGIPMAILGILPQACVADVSELNTLKTGEDRSGMFFAARTFAMKWGQSIAMLVFTSLAIIGTTQNTSSNEITASSLGLRIVAIAAAVFCVGGALVLMLYNEKKIMQTISEDKKTVEKDVASE